MAPYDRAFHHVVNDGNLPSSLSLTFRRGPKEPSGACARKWTGKAVGNDLAGDFLCLDKPIARTPGITGATRRISGGMPPRGPAGPGSATLLPATPLRFMVPARPRLLVSTPCLRRREPLQYPEWLRGNVHATQIQYTRSRDPIPASLRRGALSVNRQGLVVVIRAGPLS